MKRNVVVALVIGVSVLCAVSKPLSAQWTEPVPVNVCNTPFDEWGAFPSHDGLSLYFSRLYTDTYFYARIFQARRDQPSGPFTSLEEVLSSQFHVEFPWVSADNLRMYYTNELPTGWVIRMSTRASVEHPWPEGPVLTELAALGISLNRAALTLDERTIFFTSVYGAPGGRGGWDIWMATRPDRSSPFGAIRNLSELNSPDDEVVGSASLEGLTLYFQSDRNGTMQFFRATRHSGDVPFDALEHLSFFDRPDGAGQWPTISSDGSALYFGRGTNAGPSDLWVSYLDSVVCGQDGASCDDGNACTRTDVCVAGACIGSSPVPCGALDQCHVAGTCDPGTGACSNPIKPDGTACDDASLCTTGETCESGTCLPIFSGLNQPKPKSAGYYKQLCKKAEQGHVPYHGDQITDADAVCVANLTATFTFTTAAELCIVEHGSDGAPGRDHECRKADQELIATALNLCRARVCLAQGVDSKCKHDDFTTVAASFGDADSILAVPFPAKDDCKDAACELKEINNGKALRMNSLVLALETGNVRLSWLSPEFDDGTGAPNEYEVWRRPLSSSSSFTRIGTTAGLSFLDTTAGTSAWEYDVTAVIPGE